MWPSDKDAMLLNFQLNAKLKCGLQNQGVNLGGQNRTKNLGGSKLHNNETFGVKYTIKPLNYS